MTTLTSPAGFIEARYQRRLQRIKKRTTTAWHEYLAACRQAAPCDYDDTERAAHRRLLGRLADIKQDQRGYQLDHDQALANLKSVT